MGRRCVLTRTLAALAVLALAARCTPTMLDHADGNALWTIVHDVCSVSTWPCLEVNKSGEFALIKDPSSRAQILLVPTRRITGIEDPQLLDPATPEFLAEAWAARGRLDAHLPRPLRRDEVLLAVNAQTARTQDQLHIHIDCIDPQVRRDLAAMAGHVGPVWAPLPRTVMGQHLMARRIMGTSLEGTDPFLDLAQLLHDPAGRMGTQNLAVAGMSFRGGPGFVELTGPADLDAAGNHMAAEALQDHSCRIAG